MDYLVLWERAKLEDIGLAIETDNPREVTRHLYAARQRSPDPALARIRVCHPAGGKEVWLVKDTVDVL